jgi:hypothetical protein
MDSTDEKSDVIWGAAEIGRAIGRTKRQAFHMLSAGHLPARRIGNRWCASRQRLLELVTCDEKPEA